MNGPPRTTQGLLARLGVTGDPTEPSDLERLIAAKPHPESLAKPATTSQPEASDANSSSKAETALLKHRFAEELQGSRS